MLKQGCEAKDIVIVKGHISPDHVVPPSLSVSDVVKYLKCRSSHLLQDEFPELKKKYWGQHLWARGYFCATVGTVNTLKITKMKIILSYQKNNFSWL